MDRAHRRHIYCRHEQLRKMFGDQALFLGDDMMRPTFGSSKEPVWLEYKQQKGNASPGKWKQEIIERLGVCPKCSREADLIVIEGGYRILVRAWCSFCRLLGPPESMTKEEVLARITRVLEGERPFDLAHLLL